MASVASRKLKQLNGIFCIFKPAGKNIHNIQNAIKINIVNELNNLPCRPVKQRVIFSEDTDEDKSLVVNNVQLAPDLSDHPLVVGKRFIEDDITLRVSAKIRQDASGVLLVGINNSKKIINQIARKQYIRVYHIKCELGVCTKDMWIHSDIKRRSTFDHVTPAKLDKTIAAMQSMYQKHMFKVAGIVDMQSDKAYQAALSGYMKPKDSSLGQVIYGLKCISFEPPYFTLEVHSIYESSYTLSTLVENLGLSLRSSAAVHSIRRIRYGPFCIEDAILQRQWTIDGISDSLFRCQQIIDQSESLKSLSSGNMQIAERNSEQHLLN